MTAGDFGSKIKGKLKIIALHRDLKVNFSRADPLLLASSSVLGLHNLIGLE